MKEFKDMSEGPVRRIVERELRALASDIESSMEFIPYFQIGKWGFGRHFLQKEDAIKAVETAMEYRQITQNVNPTQMKTRHNSRLTAAKYLASGLFFAGLASGMLLVTNLS